MKRDLRLYLDDIIESIEKIKEYTGGITEDAFRNNTQLQDAVVRRLEIIGEAARRLPKSFRERHPDIPWQDIVGMRNRLTHEYFGVQLARVWLVVQTELADLKPQIQAARRTLEETKERSSP